jgi:hypothetical protein
MVARNTVQFQKGLSETAKTAVFDDVEIFYNAAS